MSDRLTIRLRSGAEAPSLAMIDEIAARHGMSSSQWVRSLIARELKTLGLAPERPVNAALHAYAEAVSDTALFDTYRAFEMDHPSARDAHLRPRAPAMPSVMRIRMRLDAHEAIALERAGESYAMSIPQVATTVLRRWIGLNKKPPAVIHHALGGIRAEIRRIGINVNQIAHAANKLLTDPRLRRQELVTEQLAELKHVKTSLDDAMKQVSSLMGLERAHWGMGAEVPAGRLELLPHPSIEQDLGDDDPP